MTETNSPDHCLHCLLLKAISTFYHEHPRSQDTDGPLKFLADVIGDQLASPLSTPLREEFINTINRRIEHRIAVKE
jgi:hypothetical protein